MLKIPNAASLILTHDPEGEVRGLNDFEEHPPVGPVFWSFRVMTGVGTLMLLVSWWGAWQLFRRDNLSSVALQAVSVMTFSGWVASVAWWSVAVDQNRIRALRQSRTLVPAGATAQGFGAIVSLDRDPTGESGYCRPLVQVT